MAGLRRRQVLARRKKQMKETVKKEFPGLPPVGHVRRRRAFTQKLSENLYQKPSLANSVFGKDLGKVLRSKNNTAEELFTDLRKVRKNLKKINVFSRRALKEGMYNRFLENLMLVKDIAITSSEMNKAVVNMWKYINSKELTLKLRNLLWDGKNVPVVKEKTAQYLKL